MAGHPGADTCHTTYIRKVKYNNLLAKFNKYFIIVHIADIILRTTNIKGEENGYNGM